MELAETLYAVGWPGSPEGESTITRGIYSGHIRYEGSFPEMLQTDSPVNPGNSGGPLISKCGVVGINTAKLIWLSRSLPSEGLGYAISSNYAIPVVSKLIKEDKGKAVVPPKSVASYVNDNNSYPQRSYFQGEQSSDSEVAYNYEIVKYWEGRISNNKKIRDSWEDARGSNLYSTDKLSRLLSLLDRKIYIAKKLWDGYTNSKITYSEVKSLIDEYLKAQDETSRLTKELNYEGSENAYKSCVKSWEDLEKSLGKDYSEEIKGCERYLE